MIGFWLSFVRFCLILEISLRLFRAELRTILWFKTERFLIFTFTQLQLILYQNFLPRFAYSCKMCLYSCNCSVFSYRIFRLALVEVRSVCILITLYIFPEFRDVHSLSMYRRELRYLFPLNLLLRCCSRPCCKIQRVYHIGNIVDQPLKMRSFCINAVLLIHLLILFSFYFLCISVETIYANMYLCHTLCTVLLHVR